MIGGTACLHDPIAQSRKFQNQIVLTDQASRDTRPNPPERVGEGWKVAIEELELEALPSRPCLASCFVRGSQHNRPARLARIAAPENAEPITFRSHLSALDAVQVSRKVGGHKPCPLGRSVVAKAGLLVLHSRRSTGLTKAREGCATWHLTVRPIAEPRAADHEVLALRLRLKPENAAGCWVSLASQ
ncbi:hypothetical protein ABIF66_011187 [Bradyrhizobium japonicum]